MAGRAFDLMAGPGFATRDVLSALWARKLDVGHKVLPYGGVKGQTPGGDQIASKHGTIYSTARGERQAPAVPACALRPTANAFTSQIRKCSWGFIDVSGSEIPSPAPSAQPSLALDKTGG
jgi:hypothetical protein